jgi:hypothetical protein
VWTNRPSYDLLDQGRTVRFSQFVARRFQVMEQKMKSRYVIALIMLLATRMAVAEDVMSLGNGVGETVEKATNDALRRAVQSINGALVITNRTLTNNDLQDISISFSQGIVRDYKVLQINRRSNDGFFEVSIRAQISDAKLKSRYANAEDSKLDSENLRSLLSQEIARARAEQQSLDNQSRAAESLVNFLGTQWPEAAFDVEVANYKLLKDKGQVSLVLPIAVYRNRPYFSQLMRALDALYPKPRRRPASFDNTTWVSFYYSNRGVGPTAEDVYVIPARWTLSDALRKPVSLIVHAYADTGASIYHKCFSYDGISSVIGEGRENFAEAYISSSIGYWGTRSVAYSIPVDKELLDLTDSIKGFRAILASTCG